MRWCFMSVPYVTLFALMMILLCVGAPVSAQTTSQTVFGDWVLACYEPAADSDKATSCALSHAVLANERLRVLSIAIGYDAEAGSYPTQLTVPLGTSLPRGLALVFEGADPHVLPFTRCDGQGCYVERPLDQALIDGLTEGGVVIIADRAGQAIRVEPSTNGLADGLTALKAKHTSSASVFLGALAKLFGSAGEDVPELEGATTLDPGEAQIESDEEAEDDASSTMDAEVGADQ